MPCSENIFATRWYCIVIDFLSMSFILTVIMKLDSYYCLGELNVMRRIRERLLKFDSNFSIFSIFTLRKCFLKKLKKFRNTMFKRAVYKDCNISFVKATDFQSVSLFVNATRFLKYKRIT